MKNLLPQLSSIFSGYDFFSAKHLCNPEVSKNRFNKAVEEAREYYGQQKYREVSPGLVHESWLQNITELENYFVQHMEEDFISNKIINGTMVFSNRVAHKIELKDISNKYEKRWVEEIISKELNTAFLSGKSRRSTLINSTHHLYHLMRFEQATGIKIKAFESIVEFGGGYGNMARIIDNFGACKRYTIIDLLLFSCIQSVFLSTATDNNQVAFSDEAKEKSKFILHPLFRTDLPTNFHADMFLSTWALSESTLAAYKWVAAQNWFGASSLLLAYHEHWTAWQDNELEESLKNNGWHIKKEAIPFLPGSSYLFATR